MNRRGFLKGILAAGVAPAVVGSGILMPVRMVHPEMVALAPKGPWLVGNSLLMFERMAREMDNDVMSVIRKEYA